VAIMLSNGFLIAEIGTFLRDESVSFTKTSTDSSNWTRFYDSNDLEVLCVHVNTNNIKTKVTICSDQISGSKRYRIAKNLDSAYGEHLIITV
jgi:hypothetical protein